MVASETSDHSHEEENIGENHTIVWATSITNTTDSQQSSTSTSNGFREGQPSSPSHAVQRSSSFNFSGKNDNIDASIPPPSEKVSHERSKSLPVHLQELETKPLERIILRKTIKGETAEERAKAIDEERKRKIQQEEYETRQQNALFLYTLASKLRPRSSSIGTDPNTFKHEMNTKVEFLDHTNSNNENGIDFPNIYSEAAFELQKQAIARFEADRKAMLSIVEQTEKEQSEMYQQALEARSASIVREMETLRWNALSEEEKARELRIKEMLNIHVGDHAHTETPLSALTTEDLKIQTQVTENASQPKFELEIANIAPTSLTHPTSSGYNEIPKRKDTTLCSCQIM